MDYIKKGLADIVAAVIKERLPEVQADVEVSRVSDLETTVRLPSHNGPRYFTIKVTENT